MKDLLEYLVKSLVSKPKAVKISEELTNEVITFNLSLAPEDMGIVIGKAGQTIRALRRLLVSRALAEKQNVRVNLNLVEIK